jgi:hypothetical protein
MDNLDEGQHRARCGDSRQVCFECQGKQPRLARLEASPAQWATRICCVARFAVKLLHFSIPLFLFSFLFKAPLRSSETPGADTSAKNTPPLSLTPLLLLRPGQTPCARCCAAKRVRLRGLSPRPIPPGGGWPPRGTPQNVGRQGLRQASGSV